MLSTTTKLLRLSQGQLNLLDTCPRKFQHTYLEQLNTPSNPEHEEKQTLGSRFHLLMQQQEMGLPIQSFLQTETQLQSWMEAFANAAPEILTSTSDEHIFRESEHYRTLQVGNYLLTAIYDLIIADTYQAQILDWKTYPQPPAKTKLEKNWQTRLYLYILAETSDYSPEQISMTYWFVQSPGKPKNIKFNYDINQHQQTAKRLNQLLGKLSQWLEGYQQNDLLPQIKLGSKACEFCQFAVKCDRLPPDQGNETKNVEGMTTSSLPSLEDIQEIPV